ncbi:4Fe-4S binding protein [Candidatus Riflebacteria bacterium]
MTDYKLYANLVKLLRYQHVSLIACADLQSLPADIRYDLPTGVLLGVALSPSIIACIGNGPTPDYAQEYVRVNLLLDKLAQQCSNFLKERGFNTHARKATVTAINKNNLSTPVPHKTLATLAGAGWVGKCALLVTKLFGSAIRFNSVFTDAPLPHGRAIETSKCGKCDACVIACPVDAPSGKNWHRDMQRKQIYNAHACCDFTLANSQKPGIGQAICGICIQACPFTKSYLKKSHASESDLSIT